VLRLERNTVRPAQWVAETPEEVAGMLRNGWLESFGIPGRNSPEYAIDFAIIDYLLPDRDGFEVLRLLRDMDSLQTEEKKRRNKDLILAISF